MNSLFLFFSLFMLSSASQFKNFGLAHLYLNHLIYVEVAKCAQSGFIINQIVTGTPDDCGIISSGGEFYFNIPLVAIFKDGSEFFTYIDLLGLRKFYSVKNNKISFVPLTFYDRLLSKNYLF